jgi:hypothetical protein
VVRDHGGVRTLRRRRDPGRSSEVALTLALAADEAIAPGDVAMLEGLGACLVLSVGPPDAPAAGLSDGESAVEVRVEVFAFGNAAPDIP